jgi:hypothetical protein
MAKKFIGKELFAFCVSIALIIIIIGEFPDKYFLALTKPIASIGNFKFDWWHVTHLWFYMVLGCASPGNYWKFTAIGSAFELFEEYGAQSLLTNKKTINRRKLKNELGEKFWFGRWEDVAVNSLGYLIGEWSTTGSMDFSFP